mgnify:CR=1 FL=1
MFMGPVTTEIWASEDIKMPAELLEQFAKAQLAAIPGLGARAEELMKEIRKVKGVQVSTATKMNIMGQEMNTTMTLLEFQEKNAPASVFEIPAGYKKTKMTGPGGY